MVTLRATKFHRWRNTLAGHPVLAMALDVSGAAGWDAGTLPEPPREVLFGQFPGLRGALDGLGAAAFVARLALEIQATADLVPDLWDVVRSGDDAHKVAFFACRDSHFGQTAAEIAVYVANLLMEDPAPERLAAALEEAAAQIEIDGLDQSTLAMVRAAAARGIPWMRPVASKHIQFGHGHRIRHLRETLRTGESAIALELSGHKYLTLSMLSHVGLPVGNFALIYDLDRLSPAAARIGYPVVLKPAASKKGRNVFVGLGNEAELRAAVAGLRGESGQFVLQSFLPGADHRLLVVRGRLIAAARREPAAVTGDGTHSIAELVAIANRDPRRGAGFRKVMNRIEIDEEVRRVLARRDLDLDSVPAPGVSVRLRATANISTGGTAVDVTDSVHPDNAEAAVKAALTLGLQVAGVDFLSPDIARSWREVGGGICEVNSIVGLRPHWIADPGRDVTGPILDLIYPPDDDGRIPTAMITGSKGKSTVTLMLSGILAAAGHTVGTVTTDGVTVAGTMVAPGDHAGYTGAQIVLRDPTVTAAALETARGGLIKSGAYLDVCDVAALLNIGREQIGMDGIDSIEDMARLKRKVLETARRAIVLNADDERCAAMAGEFPSPRKILFSMALIPAEMRRRVPAMDTAIYLTPDEAIALDEGGRETVLLPVAELPAALGGVMPVNVANAMAAAGLALGLGLSRELIAAGLRDYELTVERTGGRFSFAADFPVRTIFDQLIGPVGTPAALAAVNRISVSGRRICAAVAPGNRPDWVYAECAAALAGAFDEFVCFDRAHVRRGRRPGEIPAMLKEALVAAGVAPERIALAADDREAAEIVAALAGADDLVVVFGSDAAVSVPLYRAAFARRAFRRSG